MKTIEITEKINFKLTLTHRTLHYDTEMLNATRYLTGAKNDLLTKICGYTIQGSSITLLSVTYQDIPQAITILNI